MSECPGADGFVCIGGWLYSSINMMIFSANKRCPTCNKAEDANGVARTNDVAALVDKPASET